MSAPKKHDDASPDDSFLSLGSRLKDIEDAREEAEGNIGNLVDEISGLNRQMETEVHDSKEVSRKLSKCHDDVRRLCKFVDGLHDETSLVESSRLVLRDKMPEKQSPMPPSYLIDHKSNLKRKWLVLQEEGSALAKAKQDRKIVEQKTAQVHQRLGDEKLREMLQEAQEELKSRLGEREREKEKKRKNESAIDEAETKQSIYTQERTDLMKILSSSETRQKKEVERGEQVVASLESSIEKEDDTPSLTTALEQRAEQLSLVNKLLEEFERLHKQKGEYQRSKEAFRDNRKKIEQRKTKKKAELEEKLACAAASKKDIEDAQAAMLSLETQKAKEASVQSDQSSKGCVEREELLQKKNEITKKIEKVQNDAKERENKVHLDLDKKQETLQDLVREAMKVSTPLDEGRSILQHLQRVLNESNEVAETEIQDLVSLRENLSVSISAERAAAEETNCVHQKSREEAVKSCREDTGERRRALEQKLEKLEMAREKLKDARAAESELNDLESISCDSTPSLGHQSKP